MLPKVTNENVMDVIKQLQNKMHQVGLAKEEYKMLQFLLITCRNHLADDYPVCKTNLTGNKIMFISDTHFGENKENIELVDLSYDKAKKENIKTVVHLGDFIDGPEYNDGITAEAIKEQIALGIEHMPNDITTMLLLGNHDFYAIDRFEDVLPCYFSSPKLEILGMKCAVVNWNNFINIGLYHRIKPIVTYNPSDVDLYLQGNYHRFWVDEFNRCISLPSLGKSSLGVELMNIGYRLKEVQDAFVIASIEDTSTALFRLYDSEDSVKEEVTYDVKTHTLRKLK